MTYTSTLKELFDMMVDAKNECIQSRVEMKGNIPERDICRWSGVSITRLIRKSC